MPNSIDELRVLRQLLAEVRAGQASARRLVDTANQSQELLRALPPPFARALDQITMRLSSSAAFGGESCSFSQEELLQALALWLERAERKLANP